MQVFQSISFKVVYEKTMNYGGTDSSLMSPHCSTIYREDMALTKMLKPFIRPDSDWLCTAMSSNNWAIRASVATARRRMALPVLQRDWSVDPL